MVAVLYFSLHHPPHFSWSVFVFVCVAFYYLTTNHNVVIGKEGYKSPNEIEQDATKTHLYKKWWGQTTPNLVP